MLQLLLLLLGSSCLACSVSSCCRTCMVAAAAACAVPAEQSAEYWCDARSPLNSCLAATPTAKTLASGSRYSASVLPSPGLLLLLLLLLMTLPCPSCWPCPSCPR
ncbi:hypothetical protein COO60DRAFT_1528171, partial [Scenedesmus sp. NREL 46B-D3]